MIAPLTRDGIQRRISDELGARDSRYPRELVRLIAREAGEAAALFAPELGYLTTHAELAEAAIAAAQQAIGSCYSAMASAIASHLTTVPAPEFVAPAAGSWVTKRYASRTDSPRTWHLATGDVIPAHQLIVPFRDRTSWPAVRARCGYQLRALWHDDGRPLLELVVSDTRPPRRVCGRCDRRSAR